MVVNLLRNLISTLKRPCGFGRTANSLALWLQGGRPGAAKRSGRPTGWARLGLEALEERWLPSAVATINPVGRSGVTITPVGGTGVTLPQVGLTVNPVELAEPATAGLYSGLIDTFTETGVIGTKTSNFQAVIDWGDHSHDSFGTVQVEPNGSFEVLGSHTYQEGSYFPTVTVTDTVAGFEARAYVPQSWTSTLSALPTAQHGLAAVAGPDGRIYALGGVNNNIFLNTVQVYDPATNTWTMAAPMPTARADLAAVAAPDGRIYVLGGYDDSALNTVEVYDPATNTWTTAAPMPTARNSLAAVVGPDGRIYAFGGTNDPNENDPLNTVEVYDPTTNTWTTAAPMPTARDGLAAVAGPNGRLYAIGGNNAGILNTVEAYDPAANTWTTVTPLPTARAGLAAAAGPDSRIYAIGGENINGALNTVEAYDPATNTWSTVAPMPTVAGNVAAVAGPDGRIYALGGDNGNMMNSLSFQPVHVLHGSLTAGTISLALTEETPFSSAVVAFQSSNTLETAGDFTAVIHWGDGTPDSAGTVSGGFGRFTVRGSHTFTQPGNYPIQVDITDQAGDHVIAGGTLSWTEAADLPTARFGLAAVTGADGSIYAIGGDNGSGPVNTVEEYDPVTNTWSTAAPMPTAREFLATVTGPDGLIYALGGYNNGFLNAVEAYDPATNSWITEAPLPTARSGLAAVAGSDGRIYAIGGYNGSILNTVEAYDPATNTWTTEAPLPTPRTGLSAVVGPDGRIYAIGGNNTSGELNTMEVYDPATNTWATAAPMITARDFLAAVTGPDGRIYALGGFGSNGEPLNTVEAYAPTTNTWATAASLPTAGYALAAATGPDGRIFAIGGTNNSGTLATVDVLDYGAAARVAQVAASRLVVTGFPPVVAGTPATFTVTAVDPFGNTVPNYTGTVAFFASGAAKLPASATLTNGTGTFSATLLSAGAQMLAVSDGTLSGQQDDIVVMPAIPAHVAVTSAASQMTTVKTAYPQPMQVVVTDAYGNLVGATPVVFTAPASGAGGTFAGGTTVTVLTDIHGVGVAPMFTANTQAGSFLVTASAGTGMATIVDTNTPGSPTMLVALASAPQSNTVGKKMTSGLQVQVTDSSGNAVPLAGLTVTFTIVIFSIKGISTAGGTFSGSLTATAVTTANGIAAAPFLSSNGTAGTFTVTASAPGYTGASFSLTNTLAVKATAIRAVTVMPRSTTVRAANVTGLRLQALVTDAFGNPVAGVTVTFTVHPGSKGAGGLFGDGATVSVITDADGVATAPSLTANKKKGSFTVSASKTGVIKTASFSLTNT